MQTFKEKNWIPAMVSLAFFLSQIQSLTRFPFMHSDESWLSGLTRFMMEERSLAVTEPFFDLYPRTPHAIKSTYHLIQALFIKILGYDLFSVRFMSLVFGSLALFLVYCLARKMTREIWQPPAATLLLASMPSFIYPAHFARQEVVVLFFLLLIADRWAAGQKKTSLAASFVAMGLHPNAYLGGAALVAAGLFLVWKDPERRRDLLAALPWLLGFTLIYILASLWMNPTFFADYLTYGSTLGVTASAHGKLAGFYLFFKKLWLGISGTYYLPPLGLTLILIGASLPAGLLLGIIRQDRTLLALQVHQVVWALGILAVGRYNATSILFLIPGAVFTLCLIANRPLQKKAALVLMTAAACWFALQAFHEITALPDSHYRAYLDEIRAVVPEDAVVLANLNTEFAFESGQLYDYRNLAHLGAENESVAAYVKHRNIEYILYADELDYLHRNPDPWQVLYGNDTLWYQDMQVFLQEHCREIADFEAPLYGNRIVPFLNDSYWHLRIYKVKP